VDGGSVRDLRAEGRAAHIGAQLTDLDAAATPA
jgi:hypothetical protein